MKHIILVGNTTWSMIKFRKSLIERLISLNYKVTVISPSDKYVQEIKDLGSDYFDVKIDNKGSNPLKDFKLILELTKIYKTINPDLIVHYTIKPNIYGSIAAKLANIKSVVVVTGLGYTFINNTLVSKMAKILYKFSFQFPEKIFFINQDDKNEFFSKKLIKKEKVILIPGEGINTNFFKRNNIIEENIEVKFLLIARMLFDKGVSEYVDAAKLLKDKYLNIEFGLLGYLDVANPKAITKEQMDKWVSEEHIKFYGSTDDVKSYISQSSCIVLPSYREGISMTLMEAASMCKPLITTNVTGCRDVVDDGINGFLCEVRNASDLALKMEKMINLNIDERIAMGKAGREKMIKEFDESIVISKYLETIRQLLK